MWLDKDCIFFWRLFQDIFKGVAINFTGLLVLPNIRSEHRYLMSRLSLQVFYL
jgi:hypothetical protein